MRIRNALFFGMLLILLTACNGSPGGSAGNNIKIEDAWVRAAKAMPSQAQDGMSQGGEMGQMSGSNSAAYLRILNIGSDADELLKASSTIAASTELHISEEKDGVMTMHPVDSVGVPANGQVELMPGGLHIMLIGINKDLVAGEKVVLTLDFKKAGEIQVEAEVRAP